MKKITLFFILFAFLNQGFAQTESMLSDDHVIKIELHTDQYSSETSWELLSYDGTVLETNGNLVNNTLLTDEINVPSGCYFFKLYDSYGDGLYTSNDVYGSLSIYFDGELVGSLDDPNFGTEFIMVQIGNDCPVNDAYIESVDVKPYQKINTDFMVEGTIRNFGSANITMLDLGYTIDEGEIQNYNSPTIDVAPGETYEFQHATPINLSDLGTYTVHTSIVNVNGVVDENNLSDNLEKEVTIVSQVPMKRVLGEEATGTWCGWCPRGAVYMDSMALKYHDTWIGVAVHNNDPMVVADYDSGIGTMIAGYPSGLVDRVEVTDPSQFESAYLEQLEVIPPVDLQIVDLSYDETSRVISFNVQGLFIADITADMRFNAIILENHVTGTDAGYSQANYYSGGGNGEMGGYEDLPNPVHAMNMEYQFVARAILGGWDGTENSIPASVSANETVSQAYSYTLPENYDHTHIKVIGIVIDQETGAVMNAVQVSLGYDDVAEINSIEHVSVFPNPSVDVINVEFEVNQTQDVTLRMFDLLGKEVSRKHFENVHTGLYRTQMNVKDFNQGIYILQIDLGHESVTEKIHVVQ